MIKIDVSDIETIKNDYFDKLKPLILERANFYSTVFKVINLTRKDMTLHQLSNRKSYDKD
ncbi:MAG: hypothetical protein IPH88_15595 [Bacteroidales bacterium]|nr:hypothetical protein [Bacteroidales bacterium]